MATSTATAEAEPNTLDDVKDYAVYPLKVMARLVGLTPDTLLGHAVPTLPRHGRTSPHRVLGKTILEYVGLREVERAGRSAEAGETQAEREKRAAADVAELNRVLNEKAKHTRGKGK